MYDEYAKIRDSRGLTDSEVAEKCGVSQSIFSRWKAGKSSPSKKTRFKISQALGIPMTTHFIGKTEDGFIIEDDSDFKLSRSLNVTSYTIKLSDGSFVELLPEQAQELNRAVDAFINVYCENFLKKSQ